MASSTAGTPVETGVVEADLEAHRRELTGYCYRMLGSGFEAEDAVQETMIKALHAGGDFEGRSSLRTWLYRIATNVCIDMTRAVQRRARPMEMGPSSPADESFLGPPRAELPWVTPVCDARLEADPADVVAQRDSVRLAFVTALQHLPARQRAALILCEVLGWAAAEAADLLDLSVPAVNSALQRARATLAGRPPAGRAGALDEPDADLLGRYVDAFERYDLTALAGVVHLDVVQSMPPFAMWLEGVEAVTAWMVQPGPAGCRGSRLVATSANGCPAFGQYRPDPAGGWTPWAIQVLEVSGGRIAEMAFFLDMMAPGRLFPYFGLPDRLDG